jgi:uncharacterized damage-inducible protein DinB
VTSVIIAILASVVLTVKDGAIPIANLEDRDIQIFTYILKNRINHRGQIGSLLTL